MHLGQGGLLDQSGELGNMLGMLTTMLSSPMHPRAGSLIRVQVSW